MRYIVIHLLAGLLLVLGAVRLVYLQAYEGAAYRGKAERQQRREVSIPARRGSILDAEGRVLATTIRRPSVFVDPSRISDIEFAAATVAPILELNPATFATELRAWKAERTAAGKPIQFKWVKREITEPQAEMLDTLCQARGLANAFGVRFESLRQYPQERLACHVIGFYSEGLDQGLAGIEQRYDEELRGKPGRRVEVIDEDRNRIGQFNEEFREPIDGHSIVLTIDSHVQRITATELQRAVTESKAKWGAAVVMDPQTGEVLAMASYPDFDPHSPIPSAEPKAAAAARERMRNHAIASNYEPGSIFKPFIAVRAVDEGQARLDEVFQINGPERRFGRRLLRDTHPHDALPLAKIISESSNIGMALLGERLKKERLFGYVDTFGFGKTTGVELPGEEGGILHPLNKWSSYSPQSIPIGQELSTTAIQLLKAFAPLANDGTLYQPRLVRGVISADGRTIIDTSEPIIISRILRSQTARTFRREALGETVRTGTGDKAAIPDYQVFGKTGTAQIAGPGGYLPNAYVGSFIGGAPLEEPRAIAIVSLYHPHVKNYYGGTVAAPSVGAILAETLRYLRVPPDASEELMPELPRRKDARVRDSRD